MGLTVCVCPNDAGTLVQVGGDIDVCVEESLQEILLQIMRTHSPQLLLDLTGVSFMDCAGLRVLLRTRRRAEMRKGSVRLVAVSVAVRRILTLTGLEDVFLVSASGQAVPAVGHGRSALDT